MCGAVAISDSRPSAGKPSSGDFLDWLCILQMALVSTGCYGCLALQSKYVSTKYPRLTFTNLNINAQFVFGLLLLPFFIHEYGNFTHTSNLIIFMGTVANLLGCISAAYAFRFGIATRVQSLIIGVIFMILLLA